MDTSARGVSAPICPVCRGPLCLWGTQDLRTADGRVPTTFRYCRSCAIFVRDVSRGTQLRHLEVAGYTKPKMPRRLERRRAFYEYVLDVVESTSGRSGGSLLDVGTGHGGLPRIARNRGFEAAGVEIVPWLRDQVRDELHIPCWEELAKVEDTFDVATFIDSFMYFDDPHEVICDIDRILNGRGVLLLRIPNRNWLVRVLREAKPERQFEPIADAFVGWSLRGLRRLLAMHGFEIQGVRYLERGLQRHSRLETASAFTLAAISKLTSASSRPVALGLLVTACRKVDLAPPAATRAS